MSLACRRRRGSPDRRRRPPACAPSRRAFSVCSVKQKHSILLKYCPAWSGLTLKIAWPVTGAAREVACAVDRRSRARARRDADRSLLGLEPPRQRRRGHWRRSGPRSRPRPRPAPARRAAACRRSRSPGRTSGRAAPRRRRGRPSPATIAAIISAVRALLRSIGDGGHQLSPILAMVMKNSSTTNAPSSSAMIRARSRWRRRTTSILGLGHAQPPVGDERGEQGEQIEDRISEQPLLRAHRLGLGRAVGEHRQRQRDEDEAEQARGDAVERAGQAERPGRDRRRGHRQAVEEDLAARASRPRRPPAASASRHWRNRSGRTATAPRNAAASTGR